jgi:hypothetical protein
LGTGPVLAYLVTGGLAVGFAWRKDLLANVVAHVAVDGTVSSSYRHWQAATDSQTTLC